MRGLGASNRPGLGVSNFGLKRASQTLYEFDRMHGIPPIGYRPKCGKRTTTYSLTIASMRLGYGRMSRLAATGWSLGRIATRSSLVVEMAHSRRGSDRLVHSRILIVNWDERL